MTLTSGSESSDLVENCYPEILSGDKSLPVTGKTKPSAKPLNKPHQCDINGCNASFSRPWRLQAHKAIHLGQRPFSCDFDNCNKSYTSNYHLRRHKITAHAIKQINIKLIKCRHPKCSKEFKTRQFEKKHFMRTHEEKTCQECDKTFFKRSQLRKHLLSHSVNHPYVCDQCNAGFEHLFLLRRHHRSHVSHLCPVKTCMATFQNWSSVRKHLKSHPFDFVCGYCKKGYRTKQFLEAHIKRHMTNGLNKRKPTELKQIVCDLCQRAVKGKASLKRHIKKKHEKPDTKEIQPRQTSNKPRATRKDKGIPKKSFASVLSRLEVPNDINAHLIKEVPEEEIIINMFSENVIKIK